jgi:polar amino acid transport system substrate-binding protein
MKKFSILALCVALASVTLLSCAKKADATADNSLKAILDKKTFVLGLDASFPPMGFTNENNEIVGYDIDLAKEVAKRMGVELVTQPIDWNAKEQELNTGKIDCIWNGFTITPERQAALAFTKPYLKNAQVVVVRADSGYKTLASLAGKSVGLQAGSSAADALAASTEFKASLKGVVEFKDNLTALMDLEVKGVDAVIMDKVVAEYNITKSAKPYAVLDEALSPEDYGVGFRKTDLALAAKVQETLEAMAADGTIAKISTTWFGSDISIVGK